MQSDEYHVLGRNKTFRPSHRPLRHDPALRLDHDRVSGPFSFLNPTSAHFKPTTDSSQRTEALATGPDLSGSPAITYKWTSRNNRKGRHALAVDSPPEAKHVVPAQTTSPREIASGILRMATKYPVWDISYDVATIFTFGSVVWVMNAFFVWLPLVSPETEFKNEELYGGGITAFVGATIFEIGSFLLMAEAVNENRTGCFGWALEHAFSHDADGSSQTLRICPSRSTCTHHHSNKRNFVGKGNVEQPSPMTNEDSRSWTWFPSKAEIRTHYIHELGFLASFTQLIAATVFWISGFTALPGIYNKMSRTITIIFYWTPQVIGGTGFIISGALFMLETQPKWYRPALGTLGWWIGAWNLLGGIGFTICPAFGYDQSSWAQYQACLSTFWGSWAFLIGSVIQWYESLNKYPVEVHTSVDEDEKLESLVPATSK